MKYAAVVIQFMILSLVVGAQDIPSLIKSVRTVEQAGHLFRHIRNCMVML